MQNTNTDMPGKSETLREVFCITVPSSLKSTIVMSAEPAYWTLPARISGLLCVKPEKQAFGHYQSSENKERLNYTTNCEVVK